MQKGIVEVQVQPCSSATLQNRLAENRGWITQLAPLLLLLGIICAYLEFKIPGASLPGIIAAFCFALFFLGHYLAGLAGWEVVACNVPSQILSEADGRVKVTFVNSAPDAAPLILKARKVGS